MDIIVTIPHGYHVGRKLRADQAWWWLGRNPRHLEAGESIYFVQDNRIQFKAIVDEIEEGSATKRGRVFFHGMHKLPEPHKPYRGFRGFRYLRGSDHPEGA